MYTKYEDDLFFTCKLGEQKRLETCKKRINFCSRSQSTSTGEKNVYMHIIPGCTDGLGLQ